MPKAKKGRQKLFTVFINAVTILLLTTIVALTITSLVRVNVDCGIVTGKSQDLIIKQQYTQAYNQLAPYQKQCSEAVTKGEAADSKITKLNFHSRLAVAAYMSGKKELATAEADKGLAIMSKELTTSERKPVRSSYIDDMIFVKSGQY